MLLTKSPLQSSNRLGVSAPGALRQIVEVLRFVCNFGPWICTYKCALRVWPDLDGHSNQELRYALGRATPFPGFDRASISPHRAAFDVVVTAAIFEELIKKARWSELVQWSGEPALYTKFHFGKYRGKRYDEIAAIDPSYLQWIVEKSELEEGIKHSARHWLRAASKPSPPPRIDLSANPAPLWRWTRPAARLHKRQSPLASCRFVTMLD